MAVDIPNYRVIEKLGTGAQSRIFRARCMRTGKDYTVKIVKVVKPEDATFVDLLRTEHLIGSSVDHSVIRKVYELRMMRHRLRVRGAILFMEYVAGLSMDDKEFCGSLDEIRAYCRKMVATLGRPNGGFIPRWYADPVGAGHRQQAVDAMCQEFLTLAEQHQT